MENGIIIGLKIQNDKSRIANPAYRADFKSYVSRIVNNLTAAKKGSCQDVYSIHKPVNIGNILAWDQNQGYTGLSASWSEDLQHQIFLQLRTVVGNNGIQP